jgi:hypothetical protein
VALSGGALRSTAAAACAGGHYGPDLFYKMTLQFERKYSTQGSGAPCHVPFGFFSGFFGIFLPRLQMDVDG